MNCLITGGAGFLGSNLAERLLKRDYTVTVLDNLIRPGSALNLHRLDWGRIKVVRKDVLDEEALWEAVAGQELVYHLAAQVSGPASLECPGVDLLGNAIGTLTLLEACRKQERPPRVVAVSTNQVYGDLQRVLEVEERRWVPTWCERAAITEDQPLNPITPYGISKAAADGYVRAYGRLYGLQTCVVRPSTLYGPWQWGEESQGWLSHLVRSALRGDLITIFGTGGQVRDPLYVDDAVDALARLAERPLVGEAFNLGGGARFALSVLDALKIIDAQVGVETPVRFVPERQGDMRWYVTDHTRLTQAHGWEPQVPPEEGIRRLIAWTKAHDLKR